MTSLPSLASVDDLSVRLPQPIAEAEEPRAQAILDDVSALVRAEAGTDFAVLDEDGQPVVDVHDGPVLDVPAAVVAVVLQAARRAWLNPEGVSQGSLGDVSASWSGRASDGAVYLTRGERREVRRAAGRFPAGSIPLVSPFAPRGHRHSAGDEPWERDW